MNAFKIKHNFYYKKYIISQIKKKKKKKIAYNMCICIDTFKLNTISIIKI